MNFLDWQTKSPLTRQRVYPSLQTVKGLVNLSMTSLSGPRGAIFARNLERGFGEIEVDINGAQYEQLRDS